ncbi:MFS transporter [Streptomyces pseudovenezuelae]|uniref:MFS transporter n=1 Tax=Streptomyces pseudovenezuelae TaxID=67350 RepID=UPI0036E540AD
MARRRRLLVDLGPLRVAEFRRLWAAGIVTALGAQLTAVVVPLQIYAISGSSAWVGLAGLVGLAPMAAAALWAGALADVRDRRRVLLTTTAGIGVTSLLLWAQAWADLRSVGALLVLVGAQQALFGANSTVSRAVTPRLVRPELLPAANALQSMVLLSAGVAGPLLAGGLLPAVGSGTLYLADSVAVCATVWAVWRLPALPPVGGGERRHEPVLRQITYGIRMVMSRQVLLRIYLCDFAALSLGRPVVSWPRWSPGPSPASTATVSRWRCPPGCGAWRSRGSGRHAHCPQPWCGCSWPAVRSSPSGSSGRRCCRRPFPTACAGGSRGSTRWWRPEGHAWATSCTVRPAPPSGSRGP